VNYSTKRFIVRPFVTLQKTIIWDYVPQSIDQSGAGADIYAGIGKKETIESTPGAFGGLTVNYAPRRRWNLNVNAYWYSSQTYYHFSNLYFADGIRGIDRIPSKLIVNSSVSYEPIRKLKLSVTGKNLLNESSREFFKTDRIPAMIIAGAHFEL
jgi:outer membrane receptor protein involved in Fe transport